MWDQWGSSKFLNWFSESWWWYVVMMMCAGKLLQSLMTEQERITSNVRAPALWPAINNGTSITHPEYPATNWPILITFCMWYSLQYALLWRTYGIMVGDGSVHIKFFITAEWPQGVSSIRVRSLNLLLMRHTLTMRFWHQLTTTKSVSNHYWSRKLMWTRCQCVLGLCRFLSRYLHSICQPWFSKIYFLTYVFHHPSQPTV